jgi:hypothetical protein
LAALFFAGKHRRVSRTYQVRRPFGIGAWNILDFADASASQLYFAGVDRFEIANALIEKQISIDIGKGLRTRSLH